MSAIHAVEPPEGLEDQLELAIGGMTCASCANRIERKLNQLEGVTATVNYATEKAKVTFREGIDPAVLVDAVEQAGYTARLPRPAGRSGATDNAGADQPEDEDAPVRALRDRVIVSALLSTPVIAMAMIPALQFTYWQWLSLTLAAPVIVWAGLPFHQATWKNLKHATATMDTLITMGTGAAFLSRFPHFAEGLSADLAVPAFSGV